MHKGPLSKSKEIKNLPSIPLDLDVDIVIYKI